MPGSKQCARCGALLVFAGQPISVHPPRASQWQKASSPLSFRFRRIGTVGKNVLGAIVGTSHHDIDFNGRLSSLVSLLVPGLAQILRGNARGWFWLAAWFSAIACSLFFAGLFFGSVALGMAIALHISATVDVLVQVFFSFADRLRFSVLCAVVVACLYFPLVRLVGSYAEPVRILQDMSNFHFGDVVWYRKQSIPRLGDFVLYEIPTGRFNASLNNRPIQLEVRGLRVNRLVAHTGQKVSWKGRILRVDGQELPWKVHSSMQIFPDFEILVSDAHCFVLPETVAQEALIGLKAESAIHMGMVPTLSIQGTIVVRSYPFTRFELF